MTCPFQIGDQIMIAKPAEEMDLANRNARLYPGKIGRVEKIYRSSGSSRWSVQCTWEGCGTWRWWVCDDEITHAPPPGLDDVDFESLL